jgi:beta-1,4-N-acetylglucosaminyltransferase
MKILIHLGMGGHTSQVLRLVDSIGDKYNYEYLIGDDDKTSTKKIKYQGKVHIVKNPRLMQDKSLFKVFLKMFPTTIQVFNLLRKTKPKAIISAGPSLTIPLFWVAKLFGIKTIFIESWVRVHNPSQAGRFCYKVSDLFLVQWEPMQKVYPKAIYAGRLS